ncbi:hypothetical protein F2P56_014612 [Juglans regia]|uniref:Reverse transcriptase zinc-binding domain-containing protein n=2 Tax=Juglans regia TaxID=51240 RepID=A0A834CUE0_JUGRE|nr:uncharacterized protein LOC108992634 [Juglans regia]KAF5464541.1 hypothetical protein F2P56_014612 [Juglans regia]
MSELLELLLKECKTESGWNVEMFSRLVGMEKAEELVEQLSSLKSGKDKLIWLKNPNGDFSTSSAWQCIQARAQEIPWTKWVWHVVIPKKISIIMWKAIHECLAVDDRIRKVGIQVASRCDCCISGAYEDMNHVLATGEFAKMIWSMCSNQLGMRNMAGINWRGRVDCWHRHARGSTQRGQLIGFIPLVSRIALRLKESKAQTRRDEEILKDLQLPIKALVPMVMKQEWWLRPKNGWFKLNVDGGSFGNQGPSGVGGVIRNDQGEFAKGCGLWYLEDYWEEILQLLDELSFSMNHSYKETNVAADGLARSGAKGCNELWFSFSDLPLAIKGISRLEKIGCPYMRIAHSDV